MLKAVACFVIMCAALISCTYMLDAQGITAIHKNDHIQATATPGTDTNAIININYPPLTEREGKGLFVPIPPAGHPRLYLTNKDIPVLKEKANSPLFKNIWQRIVQAAQLSTDGKLKQNGSKQNLDYEVRNAIEAKALFYVCSADETAGREAIDAILNFYATLAIDMAKADVCRDIGRAIVTGAIVYDWCYPLLTPQEKQTLIGRMETLATRLEIAWPNLVQGSIVGHGVEAQLSRDMLSCGVAVYNEKPAIYNLAAGRIMAEFVPVRKFFYPAAFHHQGSAYGPYRFSWDMYATFIFDKLGYPEIFGKDQGKAPYYFIYSRRPDGQLFRNGDDFNELFTSFGTYWSIGGNENGFAGSYFKDPVLINEALKEGQMGKGPDYLFDFLFFDPRNAGNGSKASLPLTRYFQEPFGAMIARTGWQEGMESPAAVAEMKVGVYNFVNHQHLDAGSFQLYYKGPLAVQSGIYQGTNGAYGSEHFKNYSQRTIAHNTMLFYDPAEKFTYHKEAIINDGGQPYPNNGNEPGNLEEFLKNAYKTGEVLAHHFGPDSVKPEFSYLKGELAAAYGSKVKSFKRSFVFLNLENNVIPAALIIFDNVVTADKNFKKYWLLHSVEEPVIEGAITTIQRSEKGYNGKLVNTTLLPSADNLSIQKTGGKGNEYQVFGKNFPQSPANPERNSADGAAWRIALTPGVASAHDVFLNVMQVMDTGTNSKQILRAEKMENDQLTGTKIGNRLVLFSKNGDIISDNIQLAVTGKDEYKILIADVQKGNWKLERANNHELIGLLTNDAQLLYFTAKAGNYIIKRNHE